MAFDPDKYLEKLESSEETPSVADQTGPGEFNPDAYLEKIGSGPKPISLSEERKPAEEIPAPPETEKGDTLKDVAYGFHSGMLMGGADELRAIGSTLGSYLGDVIIDEDQNKKFTDYLNEYRASQKAAEKEYTAARESSPWASGTAEFVGGLIPGILSGGAAKAAPIATGIAGGAATGFLGSKGSLDEGERGQLAFDTGLGGTLGGIFGKILPGGPKAPEKDLVQKSPFMNQLSTAKRLGEEGIDLRNTPEARKALTERLQQNEREIAGKFIDPRSELGRGVSGTLLKSRNVEVPLDKNALSDLAGYINYHAAAIGRKEADEILQEITHASNDFLYPEDLYKLTKRLGEILPKIGDPSDAQVIKTGMDSIKSSLKRAVPEFKEATEEFAQFASHGPEALLAKGFDPDVADVFLGDLAKGELKITEKVRQLLNNMRMGGKEGLAKQGEFYNTIRELEKLAKDNPELVQRLGIDPKQLEQQVIKLADEAAVAQKTSGKAALEAGFERGGFGLRGVAEETLQRTLNLYGQKKRSMREYFNSPPESLTQDAAQLLNSGVKHLASLGEALQTAIGAGDINKRNAVLFAIMQQPKGREILGLDGE